MGEVSTSRRIPDGVLVSVDITGWQPGDELAVGEIELDIPEGSDAHEERKLKVFAAVVACLERNNTLIPTMTELIIDYGSYPNHAYSVFKRLVNRLLVVRPHLAVRRYSGYRLGMDDP